MSRRGMLCHEVKNDYKYHYYFSGYLRLKFSGECLAVAKLRIMFCANMFQDVHLSVVL